MDRVKVLVKYVIWIVVFFVLSNFLISVGLNSMYKTISRTDDNEQIQVYQAEATAVNGRIRGYIENVGDLDLNGKYIKFDFYTSRGVNIGTKYIEVIDLDRDNKETFEIFFELQNISYYTVSIEDEIKEVESEFSFLSEEHSTRQIIYLSILAFLLI